MAVTALAGTGGAAAGDMGPRMLLGLGAKYYYLVLAPEPEPEPEPEPGHSQARSSARPGT